MEEIEKRLELILRDLNEILELARKDNLISIERITLHVLSHVQTMLESLKKGEVGFSIK